MSFDALQSIVDTYDDVSEERRKQILVRAEHYCRGKHLLSFDRQYEVVAFFIEQSQRKFHRSLDEVLYSDSDSEVTLLDQEGNTDPQIEAQLSEEETLARAGTEKILSALEGRLPTAELRAMRQTLDRFGRLMVLDAAKTEAEGNIEIVKDRIERYMRKHKLLLKPDAKILSAYDSYGGNAVEASRQLPHSPSTFRKYWRDAGLEVARNLTSNEIQQILSAHIEYQGNAAKTARALGFCSKGAVTYHWRADGVEAKHLLSADEVAKVIAAHPTFHGNASAAARHLKPHAVSTILEYWRNAGLETTELNGLNARLEEADILAVVATYAPSQGSASEARRLLKNKHSIKTIQRYWRAAGFEVTEQERMTSADIDRVCATHATSNGNGSEARRQLNNAYSLVTILKWWRKRKLKTQKPCPHALTEEQIQEIIAAHALFNGDVRKAMEHVKRTRGCVIQHWVNAGLWHETPSQRKTRTSNGES